MIFDKDTMVQINPGGGIPTVRIKADCATSQYSIALETTDKRNFRVVATPSQQDVPIPINDGQVASARDLLGRRVLWKVGLATTSMNDPHNVPFAVIVEQDGVERSVSIHENLDFNNGKAALANGFISFS